MGKQRYSVIPAAAITDPEINQTCLKVLAQIGTYTDDNGWCYPKQNTIGEALGLGRAAVNRAVKKLAERGYLEVHHRFRRDGGKAPNWYRVVLDPPSPPAQAEAEPAPEKAPPHVSPAIHTHVSAAIHTPCIGSDTSHDSASDTSHDSAGDTSRTSHLNDPSISEDARACSDTSLAGPKTLNRALQVFEALKAEIGEASFNSWFAEARLVIPEAAEDAAVLTVPQHFHASRILRDYDAPLRRLLGRRIEYEAETGPPSGAVAHGVRVKGKAKAGRARA